MTWLILFCIFISLFLYTKFKYGYKEYILSCVFHDIGRYYIFYSKESVLKINFPKQFLLGYKFICGFSIYKLRIGLTIR